MKIDYIVEPKIDGVSLSFYENGNLISAATRGNGTVGGRCNIERICNL